MTYKLAPRTIEVIQRLSETAYEDSGQVLAACVKALKLKNLTYSDPDVAYPVQIIERKNEQFRRPVFQYCTVPWDTLPRCCMSQCTSASIKGQPALWTPGTPAWYSEVSTFFQAATC